VLDVRPKVIEAVFDIILGQLRWCIYMYLRSGVAFFKPTYLSGYLLASTKCISTLVKGTISPFAVRVSRRRR